MRINRIALENIRCFRYAEIDLSADVVAIYGRNGVGKTAIFDALEFALIGSIGRFMPESTGNYYLPHVLSDANGMIHIDFRSDADHWVKLNINRPNFNVSIDSSGNWRSHRDLLYDFFVNQYYFPPRREVSTVAELFRATVLLSQNSIREFVEGDIAKRSRILSYLAGSGYIQRCFDKAKGVMEEAKKRKTQEQAKLGEAERIAAEMMRRLAEHDARIEVIRKRLGEGAVSYDVVLRALEDAGISVNMAIPQTPEDAEIISASVKGASNERMTILEERSKLLAQIEAMNQQHPDRLKRRRELYEMVEESRKELVELLKRENATAEYLKDFDAPISKLNLSISEESKFLESLQMLHGVQLQRADLVKAQKKTSDKIEQIQRDLELARSRFENHQAQLDLAKRDVGNYLAETEKTSSNLRKLDELKISLPTYMASKEKIKQLESQINDLNNKRSDLEEHIAKLKSQYFKLNDEIETHNRKISAMKASAEEATDLIARLKQYATDNECPLCGQNYSSPRALQDAIDTRLKDVPIAFQEAGRELQSLVDNWAKLNADLESYTKEIKLVDDSLRKAQSERNETVLITHKIEASSVALGVPLIPENLDSSIKQFQTSLAELQANPAGVKIDVT
ncbi:MAG: AAA family ATPase [Pseudomonadota bacterium]